MQRRRAQSRPIRFAYRRLAWLVAAAVSGASYANAPLQAGLALPITFERNDGQLPPGVIFTSRGPRGALQVRVDGLAIVPRRDGAPGSGVRIALVGSNRAPEIVASDALATRSHYYLGNDPARYVTGVPHYGELKLKDVYPGVDVALHGRDGSLEYDFEVAPGADARDIRIGLAAAGRASIDAQGNLRIEQDGQVLVQHAPVAWQEHGSTRSGVPARFEIVEGDEGLEARVQLGAYDRHQPLTIDPVITYSTYVGSSGADVGAIVKVDPTGDIYYAQQYGIGSSATPFDPVVVTRLHPATNTVIYQTHFGASGSSGPAELVLGGSGSSSAYVVGFTSAINFPAIPPKTNSSFDAFVTVLAPDGTLSASRVVGGSGSDFGNAIALDAAGNVYVGGSTNSTDLAITTGERLNRVGASGASDGFVAKLDASLNLVYLRNLGGSGTDGVSGLAVDPAGQAIAVGSTSSPDFITANVASPSSPAPGGGAMRAFAAKLTPDGTGLAYSEFIGGQSSSAAAVALDPVTGEAVIGGTIGNANIVPASTVTYAGGNDAFVVRLDASGAPTFATFLGGSGNDGVSDVAVSPAGDVWLVGTTYSRDFPVVAPLAEGGRNLGGSGSAYVARLHHGGVDFASYVGGSGTEFGTSVALGADGAAYVGGYTSSTDLPVLNAYRSARSGSDDGFITRIEGFCKPASYVRDFFLRDGRGDLLIAPSPPDGTFQVLEMSGLRTVAQHGIGSYGSGGGPIQSGNFHGSSAPTDVLFRNPDGSVALWAIGPVSIPITPLLPPGTAWSPNQVGDFNGDGQSDILWTNTDDGSVGLWLMSGGTISQRVSLMGPGSGWRVVQVGDFNGDGKSDILWAHTDGTVSMWLMNGTTIAARGPLMAAGLGWSPVQVGDFDGDGKADILWQNTNGATSMWLMNGLSATTRGPLMPAGSPWRATAVGDFNGDGKADIVWSAADGSVGLWLMDGLSQLARTSLMGPGTGWSVNRLTDANGDCRADIVWTHTNGTVSLWIMSGTTILQRAAVWLGGVVK